MDATQVIEKLQLTRLPEEGGYYRETYRSGLEIAATALPPIYVGPRNVCTAIYYLVTPDQFSALHRLPSDEVFHFYAGDPVDMLQLPDEGEPRLIRLGNDLAASHQPQVVAPGHVWQGTQLVDGGRWALLGCTVAPGFDFRDFRVPTPAELAQLQDRYPQFARQIKQLRPQH